ncbi:hypothetical protein AB0H58_20910 [Nocardia neocaledoniensis]|uniref:hypothetical protein n=1 Tax=Nocardia neocaledoniensis TaxID=236511 RepID=UPI003407644E
MAESAVGAGHGSALGAEPRVRRLAVYARRQRVLTRELAGLAGRAGRRARGLARALLVRRFVGTVSRAGAVLPRELPGLTGQLYARKFTRSAWLRRGARSAGRGFAGTEHIAGAAGSGTWVLAESTGVTETGPTLPGAVAIGRTVRLSRSTGHGQTGTGLSPPLGRRFTPPRPGDVAFPGRHPALPRRDGRVALRRSVAIIVVVVPMSGIIVAHHASCTRRNPRCPPVR